MKIMYCVTSIGSIGGITKITIDKANYLSQNGYEVVIVTTEDSEKKTIFPVENKIKIYKLPVNYKESMNLGFFSKLYKLIIKKRLHKKLLRDIILNVNPDIIVCTSNLEISFLNKIKYHAKIILEIHDHYNAKYLTIKKKYKKNLEKFIFIKINTILMYINSFRLEKFDYVVVLSNEEKKYWNNSLPLVKIPNFIDINYTYKANLDSKIVITAGRLEKSKGTEILIDIWYKINKIFPDWKLIIYGSGTQYNNLLSKINKLELDDSVFIFSPVSNIFKELSKSSIFISASQFESFGMTLIEAQSVGLPVIAYDCPTGPRSIIKNNENGFLIDLNNQVMFQEKLISLISNKTLREIISKNAYKNSRLFSKEIIMDQWTQLFKNTIKDIYIKKNYDE